MKQDRMEDGNKSNRQSDMEPAEGSRETIVNDGGEGRMSNGSGISNRGRDLEEELQERLPERGHAKSDESERDDDRSA
jgi:hypothetical protein